MPAISYKKTAVDTDSSWDGPANEARLSNDAGADTYKKYYAWIDPDKDPDTKSAYKFGHHNVSEEGQVGAANLKGCQAVIAVLNGARGGANIPDSDRQEVYNHVARHIRDAGEEPAELASNASEEKHPTLGVHIEKNALVDDGDGLVRFPSGLTITDDSTQKNGTRYDIPSMDISNYKGNITADHVDRLDHIIGKAIGVAKQGAKVTIDGIRFAVKENALAKTAYDLLKGGFVTDFSIETFGPPPTEEGVYYGARLIGLSAVVVGNNDNASYLNSVHKSIEQSKEQGLDTKEVETLFKVDNSNVKENKEMATEVKEDVKKVEEKSEATDLNAITEAIKTAVEAATSPLQEKIESMEKQAFDKAAEEPKFKKESNGIVSETSKLASMDSEERTVNQIESARRMLVSYDQDAAKELRAINEFNLSELKKEGLVKNALTIADFGNFVICRELLEEIQGCRNDYTPLVDAVNWRETLSTQFAWLTRNGDINMQNVAMCEPNNLKPISEYGATIRTADLEELAAVTPVCNAATRFLAADLLGDVSLGYRTDYDRKRAQLVIARLEQAVEANGNSVIYDVNPASDGLVSFVSVWQELCSCTSNGVFIMSCTSWGEFVKQAIRAGVNGPLANLVQNNAQEQIFGKRVIVVSDDLLPALNSAQTRVFQVDGVNVTVNHAVFYVDLNNFTGRISGGLQYDLSTEAAYEDGGVVKSAYQRNELVLRGSFFRGGAILDNSQVAGLLSPGVS